MFLVLDFVLFLLRVYALKVFMMSEKQKIMLKLDLFWKNIWEKDILMILLI